MSNIGSNAGSGLRGGIRSVQGSNDSAAQNQAISDRGVNEFQTGSTHHNPDPGSSFDKHPSDVRAPAAGHQPGSAFDKHPSDLKAAGLRGNPGADNWGSSNTTSSTGAYGYPTSTNAEPHSSSLENKADPRIDSDFDGRGVTGSHTGSGAVPHSTSTSGRYGYPSSTHDGLTGSTAPHGLNALNKADPRIDSDHDNRGLTGNQTGAAGGSHKSNILNKADPRVDNDFDNRGAHPTGHSTGGHAGTKGSSKAGQTSGDPTGISRPSNAGVPTLEDDRGNLRLAGAGGSSSTNAGPHDSNFGNKVDPRVDSDRDNRAAHHGVGTGVTPGSYGSEGLASDRYHNTTTSHPSTGTSNHHNVGTGVTPDSYGSEGLESGKTHRPDSGHVAHDEHSTSHVKDGESTENKGSHPLHKSNLLNKLDPRIKTSS